MINNLISTYTQDRLLKDAKSIVIPKKEQYLTAYKEFINYFENLDKLSEHHIIIGISFTYSWMPTILDFRSNKIIEATQILNYAKQGNRPSLTELDILKSCFNNSLVGSSKLLHFINPNKFAIWDSRVYRYLFNQTPHSYRVENNNTYLNYLYFCDHLINSSEINTLKKIVEEKVGYTMTKMRAIELIFFYNGTKSTNR
ncbi:MAG: hypothetical protein IPK18_03550 [Sphingobacteriales bacterium]|nr:MAG: hypothetical protein IPK18_03550 [Sphingobacteriales bacterium]